MLLVTSNEVTKAIEVVVTKNEPNKAFKDDKKVLEKNNPPYISKSPNPFPEDYNEDLITREEGFLLLESNEKELMALEDSLEGLNEEILEEKEIIWYNQDSIARLQEEIKYLSNQLNKNQNEINQLKKELADIEGPQGFGALRPIYNFYENTMANVLKKQGYTPKE